MSEYKLTPFGEPANTTDEGREILASLSDKERIAANIESRVLYGGRDVDAIDLQRLRFIFKGVQITRRENERRANPIPGTCWQCGAPTSGSECRPCHEGMTPAQYGRAMGRIFLTKPNSLPAWMH